MEDGKRVYISEGSFTIRTFSGEIIESIPLTTTEMLLKILEDHFGLKLTEEESRFKWKFP